MNSGLSNYLIYIVIALLVVFIIVTIVKKAIKLLIFIIVILLSLSAYDIFIKGVSPIDEFNGYKINAEYAKSIGDYTIKIKTSVDNIKSVANNKTFDTTSLNVLKKENTNLNNYLSQVQALKHTQKLNSFHQTYCSYLKTITQTSDDTVNLANNNNSKELFNILNKFTDAINGISKISGNS